MRPRRRSIAGLVAGRRGTYGKLPRVGRPRNVSTRAAEAAAMARTPAAPRRVVRIADRAPGGRRPGAPISAGAPGLLVAGEIGRAGVRRRATRATAGTLWPPGIDAAAQAREVVAIRAARR